MRHPDVLTPLPANAGSPPTQGGNRYIATQPIESAIWSYEITTGEFTPHWRNTDGTSPPTYVVIINSNQGLFITGDVTALANDFGANTQVVRDTTLLSNLPSLSLRISS
jgi:hypothetical protein